MAKPRPSSSADNAQIAKLLQEAVALHQRGALGEAESRYARVLERAPANFNALHLLGLLRHQQGRSVEALQLIAAALRSSPVTAEALSNYGVVLDSVGRHDEAVASFDKALAIKPSQAEWHYKRGRALAELNRHDDAITAYDRTLGLNPGHLDARVNRGSVLLSTKRFTEALADFDAALAIKPDYIDAHNNRAIALYLLRRQDDALAAVDAALAIEPRFASAHNNKGNVLLAQGRFAAALASYEAALAVDPNYVDAMFNCGNALAALDRPGEAERCYDKAIAMQPHVAEIKVNKGLFCLARGRFAEGWSLYEARWSGGMRGVDNRAYAMPRWNGEPVGRLLVWGEQGLGDQILYASMLADARARATSLALEVEARMVTLFARSFPDVEVVGLGQELHSGSADAHVPISGLGRFLRGEWASFGRRREGYLAADPARAAALRERLAADGRAVIGLSWRSSSKATGRSKSARLHDFEPILRLSGCRFVDLQYGDTRDDRAAVAQDLGLTVERFDDIDNRDDIDGLAALMTACDAVVTVSNTTAHLAGALGRPTFVFVPFGNSQIWYWFNQGDTSPWYPDARVRRQSSGEPWLDLIARSVGEVGAVVAGG
jgi:tetratricopeptide (TPR) repeat protein